MEEGGGGDSRINRAETFVVPFRGNFGDFLGAILVYSDKL